MWTRPQFRQPGGGVDWMQVADLFIPGNVWNSRTDRFRPLGIAEGLTGIPVDTAAQFARWASNQSNPFEGVGEAFRSGGGMLNRLRALRERGLRSEDDYYRNWDNAPPDAEDAYYRNWDQSRPATVDSYSARTGSLGIGQLGRGGFANQMYYDNAIRNRGGALMER